MNQNITKEEIINMLKAKGYVKHMQNAVNSAGSLLDASDDPSKTIKNALCGCLLGTMERDDEVNDAILMFSIKRTVEEIVDDLNIKPDPNAQVDESECVKLLRQLIKELFK